MRSIPLASVIVRTALAVVFAFMSLFHGTVMSFAQANPSAHHAVHQVTQVVEHSGHRGHAGHEQKSNHVLPDTVPACLGIGCFIALQSTGVSPPTASVLPVAVLSPESGKAITPAALDPAVPPPRFHV